MVEARLLSEIGLDGTEVPALQGRLGLDSGYLRRVLRSLEEQGLVAVSTNPEDGSAQWANLTEAGQSERAELDQRSDELADSILDALTDRQRSALTAAMGEVERLLQASMVSFAIEDPTTVDARSCVDQYFAELNTRFEAGFNPSLGISADAHELTPPAGLLVIARLRGRSVGCGALKFHKKRPAELKRMWIAPAARGLGVGRRLLNELEAHARKIGVTVLRLETNRALTEAIALYRRSGYIEVDAFNTEPYANHWFEKHFT